MCVCLPSFYSTNEREREERFPFRKSGDKGEALNAETLEGKLQNLPTQGKFLVSLNPSNCPTGQVLAAKSTTVTQEMNKFKLALRARGCWSQRERRSLSGDVPKHLGPGSSDKTEEIKQHFAAETLVSTSEFLFQGLTYTCCETLGKSFSSSGLRFPGLKSQRVKTSGIWAPL